MRDPRVLVLVGAVALGCRPAAPDAGLLREFAGSYPREAQPTGVVRHFEIVAALAELPLIDGTRMRVWAYNGQVPGPTLRVRLGETVQARLTNHLPEATTIHWHGVRVPNDMDGVPTAARPPIEPGASFTYQFTPKDAGTFWFHPHIRSSEQVERGLYGVLIVEDPRPAPYARDEVWVIDDWLLDERRQIFPEFNTPHDLAHDGRWGNAITVNGRSDTRLRASAGERIRLRLLNASNGRVYAPIFSGLRPQIIAVDGLYLRAPVELGRFELAPGNRVDLDVTVPAVSSAALAVVDHFYEAQPNHLADVVVEGVAPGTGAFPSPAHGHVPAWRGGLAAPVTQEIVLDARRGGRYGIEWTLNGEAFTDHAQAHAHAALALARGRYARLRFVNRSYRLHPMHLHGMFFKLLARNGAPIDEPFFRDTVLVHSRETVDVGLVPLDAGQWMMHCHVLEHAEAGMMAMISVL